MNRLLVLLLFFTTGCYFKRESSLTSCSITYGSETIYFKNCKKTSEGVWYVEPCSRGSKGCYLVNQAVKEFTFNACTAPIADRFIMEVEDSGKNCLTSEKVHF
jgi:hypothetical protein